MAGPVTLGGQVVSEPVITAVDVTTIALEPILNYLEYLEEFAKVWSRRTSELQSRANSMPTASTLPSWRDIIGGW